MNRRGDVELVINTRVLERVFWIIVVIALGALLFWRWDGSVASGDAATQQEVATLQAALAERDARIASLEAASEPSEPAPEPEPTTPPPKDAVALEEPTPAAKPKGSGMLDILWDYELDYPSSDKMKLTAVTITADNGLDISQTLSYELCWSSIDCTNAVARGTFSVPALELVDYPVALTIPTFVDSKQTQRLRLTMYDAKTNSELLREDIIVK